MRKTVLGKVLSVLVAAALAFSPAVETSAASNEEVLEIIDVEETADDEIEAFEEVSEEQLIEDEYIDSSVEDEEYVNEANVDHEINFIDNKSELIPDSATPVGEPYEMGLDLNGQLYEWSSDGVDHIGLYIYGDGHVISNSVKSVSGLSDYQTLITDVVMVDSISEIGEQAFYECTGLTNVVMPKNLRGIGRGSFEKCKSLKTIDLADGLTTIGSLAFRDCISLTSVIIPKTVTAMGDNIFTDCTSLTEVTFAEGMTNIPEWALFTNTSLYGKGYVRTVNLPSTLKKIGDNAFFNQENLEKINYNGCIISEIGSSAFAHCKNLQEIVFTNGLTTIGSGAFVECKSLKSVVIPKTVTTMGDHIFSECTSLFEVTFAEGMTEIPEWALFTNVSIHGNGYIKVVHLPSTIKAVKENAFYGQDKLQTVYYAGNEAMRKKIDIADGNTYLTDAEWIYGSESGKNEDVTNPKSLSSAKIAGLKTTVGYTGEVLTVSDLFNANDKTCKQNGWNSVTLYVVDKKTKAKTALVEGSDYTISIEDKTTLGKVKVSFTGINGFKGTVSKSVTIKAANVAKNFDITVDDATYTKGGVKPEVTVTYAGKTLERVKDYTVTYKNNKKAASSTDVKKAPYVIVKGIGNYTGTSNKVPFTINKANVSDLKIQADDIAYNAKGKKGYFIVKPVIIDNDKKVTIGKNKDIKATYTYTYAKKTTLKDGTVKAAGDLVNKNDKLSGTTSIKITATVEAGSAKSSYEGTTTLSCTYKVIDKNNPSEEEENEPEEKEEDKQETNPVKYDDGQKAPTSGQLDFSVGENKDRFMINDSENTINFTFLSNATPTTTAKFYINNKEVKVSALSKVTTGNIYEFSYKYNAKNYEILSAYIEIDNKRSNVVTISAYKPLTEENVKAAKNAIDAIESIDDSYVSNGSVDSKSYSTIISAIEKEAQKLEKTGEVIEHRKSGDHVSIKFANGIKYEYSVPNASVKGSGKDISVSIYQPFADPYDIDYLPSEQMDATANYIDKAFDSIILSHNLDNADVTPASVFNNISRDQVVIWDGHGGFNEEYGTYLITGACWDGDYSVLPNIDTGWCLVNDFRFAITSASFEQLPDNALDNTFIVLDACNTARSAGDTNLCKTLISKGASAVVGFSNVVELHYANNLMQYMLEKMCEINPDTGMYYTAYEALSLGICVYGENDWRGTMPIYFGDLNYRFSDAIITEDEFIPNDGPNRWYSAWLGSFGSSKEDTFAFDQYPYPSGNLVYAKIDTTTNTLIVEGGFQLGSLKTYIPYGLHKYPLSKNYTLQLNTKYGTEEYDVSRFNKLFYENAYDENNAGATISISFSNGEVIGISCIEELF